LEKSRAGRPAFAETNVSINEFRQEEAQMPQTAEMLLDGGTFFEGPRWHGGRWWVSDFFRHSVFSFDPDGSDVKVEVVVDAQPSGLGWAPDGSLLVVSMLDRRVLRRASGSEALDVVADLGDIAGGPCNDMVVDSVGRAWVGNFGFDHFNAGEFATASLVRVDPEGSVSVAASDLSFPNGMVITEDGGTLLVGETFASRYTAFRINPDGTLVDRRLWAELPGVFPDGCSLDAEGRLWVADARGSHCLLVKEGGSVVERVAAPVGLHVFACMLGGPAGTTLLMCCAPDSDPHKRAGAAEAVIAVTEVEVAGAGLP
jgi:sugar lactone lactonase YvrE